MRRQTWASYWVSTERSFLERLIQLYKAKIGYKKLLQAVPEIGTSGRALEVGGGKAWISRLLRRRGWRTTAIDLEPKIVKANASAVEDYVIGDTFNLPFKVNSFDLVMSCGLLEHFTLDEVQKILSEMSSAAKSVVAWFPTCGLEWKVIWTVRNILGGDVYPLSYIHRKEDLKDIFVSSGLQSVRVGVVMFAGVFRYIYIYGTSNNMVTNIRGLCRSAGNGEKETVYSDSLPERRKDLAGGYC